MTGVFKAYDIRGSYPREIDEGLARRIGTGFVDLLGARRIVVGRDMRPSASILADALIKGALAAGSSVTDAGLVTTPLLYHAVIAGAFDGGVMVTASHLPAGMNGFKLCRADAVPLSGDRGLPALEQLVTAMSKDGHPPVEPGRLEAHDFLDEYMDFLVRHVHDPRPLRVVVDAGNGMAGPEVARFFERVKTWTLIPMYLDPDGAFPHHVPNPVLPSTTKELQERVVSEKADLGVAFDGDADRAGFIDEQGRRVPNDLIIGLIAEFFLSREPCATALYDLRSTRAVPELITRLGGRPERSRVGHSFIKARMRELDAIFAGELSGHFYFRDTGFTDNAMFAMIQVFNGLSLKRQPLSSLVEPLLKYASSGEINIRVKDKDGIFSGLESEFHDAYLDHLDGITVEYPDWWFNLRPSNTEPVVRLNLEASDPQALEQRKRAVLEAIRRLDPAMDVQAE